MKRLWPPSKFSMEAITLKSTFLCRFYPFFDNRRLSEKIFERHLCCEDSSALHHADRYEILFF